MSETALPAQSAKSPPGGRNRPPSADRPERSSSCLETPVVTSHFSPSTDAGVLGFAPRPLVAENDHPDRLEPSESFEHARVLRKRIMERLEAEDEDELAAKLAKCGAQLLLHCSACGHQHIAEQRCSLKWCPVCARKIVTQRSLKFERAASFMKWPLLVTLTRSNVGDISPANIRNLKKAFTKLRTHKLWKAHVKGGIAGIEMTNKGRGWHPHLHTFIDCEWLAWRTPKPRSQDSRARKAKLYQRAGAELEAAWSKLIGQFASSIDVRRKSANDALHEATKYAVKGSDLADSPDAIGPAIRALSSCRLTTSFGSLYGKKLITAEETKPPVPCPHCKAKHSWVTDEQVQAFSRQAFNSRRGKR